MTEKYWSEALQKHVTVPGNEPITPSLHREPIEADREAAAEVFAKQFGKEASGVFAIRTGEMDDHYLVQAFMRHRLAFSTPAASDAEGVREACAKVAEEYLGQSNDGGEVYWEHFARDSIAAAIRSLHLPKAGKGES